LVRFRLVAGGAQSTRPHHLLKGDESAAFRSDGKRVVTASDDKISTVFVRRVAALRRAALPATLAQRPTLN
jgi:hypothetical protein